jgi:hypothetical protein
MIGDIDDFVRRLRGVLPRGWFADIAPVAESILASVSVAWQANFGLITTVRALARILTATGPFLDMISTDFFGSALPRRVGEGDEGFVRRIEYELFRPRGTRGAVDLALFQLTGRYPLVIEPARPGDTGGYSLGGVGYCIAGAWGNLDLRNSCFVTAYRPLGAGIAEIAGFGTGGPIVYGSLSMVEAAVTDADIFESVSAVLPLGCTAWVGIQS